VRSYLLSTAVFRCLPQISARRSFWMISKLSSIVIMNLIANLRFLYHKR
jgi:hypothetical protein